MKKLKSKVSDQQILDMLKQGKAYTDIQADLSVSPSRISIIKKKNLSEVGEALEKIVDPDTTKIEKPILSEKEIESKLKFDILRAKTKAAALKVHLEQKRTKDFNWDQEHERLNGVEYKEEERQKLIEERKGKPIPPSNNPFDEQNG